MPDQDRRLHWENVYTSKEATQVSWYEAVPAPSLELIRSVADPRTSSLIDIGGGASLLVDALLAENMADIAVLDLSATALESARARLGHEGDRVEWIAADVTRWRPGRVYDIWHDRAAFHFLIEESDRTAYAATLEKAVAPGGHAIIATFAPDGPERCSGLSVRRYEPAALAEALGAGLRLLESRRHIHITPWGATQSFQYSLLLRA